MEENKDIIPETEQKKESAKPKASKTKKALVKVEFVKSPTGILNLAYHVGEVAEFEEKQAANLVELGLAKTI